MRRSVVLLATALLVTAAAALADTPDCGRSFVQPEFAGLPDLGVAVAAADMDGDGIADIVAAENSAITVYLVALNGTLGQRRDTAMSDTVLSMAVGDFDEDGVPDVAVAGANSISFLKGMGDGTFAPSVALNGLPVGPVAATDVNGDGHLDLVGLYYPTGVDLIVRLGHGNGTFEDQGLSVVDGSRALGTGDFNGDGFQDVVLGGIGSSELEVFLSVGDGSFGLPTRVPIGGFGPYQVAVGDFDGDGFLDIASVAFPDLVLLRGLGDGTFDAPAEVTVPRTVWGVVAGDLNGDGNLDLAVLYDYDEHRGSTGSFLSMLGRGDGRFSLGPAYATAFHPTSGVAMRLGSEPKPTFVVVSSFESRLVLFRGEGPGGAMRGVLAGALEGELIAFATSDFDGDGLIDSATASYDTPSTIAIRPGTSDQVFFPTAVFDVQNLVFEITPSDLDADGQADLAVAVAGNPGVALLRGHGDGSFDAPTFLSLPGQSGAYSLAVHDFDEDGIVDILVAPSTVGATSLFLFRGDGHGGFLAPLSIELFGSASKLLAADFDGDGHTDVAGLVLQGGSFGYVYTLRGHGDGTFDAPVVYEAGRSPLGIASGDFDEDGILDLVIAGPYDANVTILRGRGDASFDPPLFVGSMTSPSAVAVADFDGDGHQDIATSNGDGTVSVLRGLGNLTFEAGVAYAAGASLLDIRLVDVDGNGTMDAIVADGYLSAGIKTLLNARLAAAVSDGQTLPGNGTSLVARASGFGALTYQWRKDGVALSDGGAISGSHTATLTIDPASFTDAGSYDVVVTDSCTSVTSNPATLAVEFADVPVSSPFHDDILTVATAGITAGCGGGNYCPTSPVRRDQMAVFLLRAEHGAAYAPPACAGHFADVPCPGPFTDWIEQLAAENITGGCGSGNYCPAASVTRAQMAVFLLKAKNGSAYTPPPATGIFLDVPIGAFAADFIENLYDLGISGGCSASPLLYCPDVATLRQQMATLLVRTFALP